MEPLALGVDIAMDSFAAALWQDGGCELGPFPNTPSGFARLRRKLARYQAPQQPLHLVLEATGGYERGLVHFAHQAGWRVSRPNAKQVRDWARGMGQRAKTDRQDALLLAHFAAARKPPAEEPLPAEIDLLASLLRRRTQLQKMLQQERSRAKQLPYHPRTHGAVPASLGRVVEALQEELQAVEQAIKELQRSEQVLHQQRQLLLSVPGIGIQSAATLLVLRHRFHARTAGQGTAKGLTAYVGLDPLPHESGGRALHPSRISRMGSTDMRSLLYMCALGGTQGKNSPLRAFYEQLVGRGKPKKVALVAAARKILVWAYAIFLSGQPFDLSRHPVPAPAAP